MHPAPADVQKAGTAYDLPIAVGILVVSEQAPRAALEGVVLVGELALNGDLGHIHGALPVEAMLPAQGLRRLVLPAPNAPEAALIDGIEVQGIRTLGEWIATARGESVAQLYDRQAAPPPEATPLWPDVDFADVRGQEHVKRALEVAAGGGHNLLMVGPPGAGKTLLDRALPGILPPLTNAEALEVTKIYSVVGELREGWR